MSDTLSICILKYFLATVKDIDIRSNFEFALQTSEQHVKTISDIFGKEGYPIPHGFTDEDVDVTAQPLYSDSFTLFNLRYLAGVGLKYYSMALPHMARQDMVDFLTSCINSAVELTRRLINIKLEKGIYLRPPIIEIAKKVAFIESKNFTTGFFGEKRSLITAEVTQLYYNVQSNIIGKALFTGFAQVTKSEQIRNYLNRGIEMANKHIEIFSAKLKQEDIPIALPSDSFVTDSTEAPFSDKILMFKSSLLCTASIENYASATTTSMRHDIQADFIRLAAEVAKFGSDGLNMLIENGWMEQPPQAINHADLVRE